MAFSPQRFSDLPVGAVWEGGHYSIRIGDWKSNKPVIDQIKCSYCLQCYIFCPEGAIKRKDNCVETALDFCKGCGICENVCTKKAVKMVKEE